MTFETKFKNDSKQTFDTDFTNKSESTFGAKFNSGVPGKDGKSAYEIWLSQGNQGTEQDFLDSLIGADGKTPTKGKDYWTPEDRNQLVDEFAKTITEEWTFTLMDGTTVTKKVAIA